MTKLRRTWFPHFQCLTLSSRDTSRLSVLSLPGQEVGSDLGEVNLGVRLREGVGRGRVFSRNNDTGFVLDSLQTRPDPTRDLDLGAQFSYPISRPTPVRPDLTLE